MYERPGDLPPANWYPDPERPERYVRYWDGAQWTVRQLRPMDLPNGTGRVPLRTPRPIGRGTTRLGTFVRIAVIVAMVVAAFQILLTVWGLDSLETAIYEGDFETLDTFDDVDLVLTVVFVACMFVAGVCWMVWQWRLARSMPPESLRRSPGWHAWSWVVPIVSFWFPYQNVSDLWRAQDADRGRTILGWWWGAFIASFVLERIAESASEDIDSFGELRTSLIVDLVGYGAVVVAGALAIRILSTLNTHARKALVSPEGTPAA